MVQSQQIIPGMMVLISGKYFKVESCLKVATKKGKPFIRTKLRNMETQKITEKNFQIDQTVEEVHLEEKVLEYLYQEDKYHLFLDVKNLNQIRVSSSIVEDKAQYLKEGVEVKASFFGEGVFSIELPQFLEFMVVEVEGDDESLALNTPQKITLETGAKVEAPPFIEIGDIIKIDTKTNEYIQRV